MEQIYTIPVNEAFDYILEKQECSCPFCILYKRLQNDELDIILGASMMEPDIRIKTNELGFCGAHFNMMHRRQRMLGIGLILESHLESVIKKVDAKSLLGLKPSGALESLEKLEHSCYICERIDKNLSAMISTAVYLWESDFQFREKFSGAKCFCLPHYRRIVDYASKKMKKKNFSEFYQQIHKIELEYVSSLKGDVSWFCKKFDYRYDEEPWYNSKDSVKRSIKFLSSDTGWDE